MFKYILIYIEMYACRFSRVALMMIQLLFAWAITSTNGWHLVSTGHNELNVPGCERDIV